jgi:CHAT domain-containing protein
MHRALAALITATVVNGGITLIASPGLSQTSPELTKKVLQMERDREKEFEDYFDEDLATVSKTADQTAAELSRLSAITGTRSALLYVIPRKNHLHLVLITPGGTPIVKDFYDVTDPLLFKTAQRFHTSILRLNQAATQTTGQQLYDWIIKPYEQELKEAKINLLLFCLGDGIKDLALPALSNNNTYLIETYAMSRIPAFNLIDTRYKPFESGALLAMGASKFQDRTIPPLPGATKELNLLNQSLNQGNQNNWTVNRLENRNFTQNNINRQMATTPYSTLHISTHSQFKPGKAHASYIQLWDQKLKLNALNTIAWKQSGADLIVLSSCQSALGDQDAANGFAGLALKAGIPSAIGTLWSINDKTTATLMKNFYQALPNSTTKAQALQSAQVAALRGTDSSSAERTPYYWAGFSLISTPW